MLGFAQIVTHELLELIAKLGNSSELSSLVVSFWITTTAVRKVPRVQLAGSRIGLLALWSTPWL